MAFIAVLVAYVFGVVVGYMMSKQEIKITIKKEIITHTPVMEPLSDEEAQQYIDQQEVLQSAQTYLDNYLREED